MRLYYSTNYYSQSKKIDVRFNKTLKLKFILMLFDCIYPTRPSYIVTKYTIPPPPTLSFILLVQRLFKWSWVLSCYLMWWLAKPDWKMPGILLSEVDYLLEFVFTNPSSFLSRPFDTKIQTTITWWKLQQKFQKFENVHLWTSNFWYANLKIVLLITSELFNRNLPIVHPPFF